MLQSTDVLDQLRERIQNMHYSLSTDQVYGYWVRFSYPEGTALQIAGDGLLWVEAV